MAKYGVRRTNVKKRIKAQSPITQTKRKYSGYKYAHPCKSIVKGLKNKVYKKCSISIFDSMLKFFK